MKSKIRNSNKILRVNTRIKIKVLSQYPNAF